MMKHRIIISLLALMTLFFSCNDPMDQYYKADTEAAIDLTVLELLKSKPEFSTFASLFMSYQLDTLFDAGKTMTVFVPSNDAFASDYEMFLDTLTTLKYYVAETYINVANIQGESVVQTIGEKYVNLKNVGGQVMFDDAYVNYESPLCRDGKLYGLSLFVQPKPSLYEYISATNLFYKNYIDAQDSSRLDPNSTPIGYDDDGNTVYDTLWIEENYFALDYFPVKEELRDERATLLLFTGEQMESALEEVRDNLGLASVSNIPTVWINKIMMPAITDQSVFARELLPADFASGIVKNINGDSVKVQVDLISEAPFLCSNGYAYNYTEFHIPEALYYGTDTLKGKDLAVKKNLTEYAWSPDVAVEGTPYVPAPVVEFTEKLGGDILTVDLKESETFALTSTFSNIFPGDYLLVCNVKSTPSGKFKIYANDKLLDITLKMGFAYGGTSTKDYLDFYDLRDQKSNTIRYVSDQKYASYEGFRTFEVLIEDIEEYGDVDIRIEYLGPSPKNSRNKGLILNYMTLKTWTGE